MYRIGAPAQDTRDPKPTHPRTSTREQAVVGVGGTAKPMNERRRPSVLNVDTRGVEAGEKGSGVFKFEVTVTMCGVLALSVGDGGKTKSVWDGVLIDDV